VTALAISPDARVLLSGGRDHTSQFTDAETGLPLGPRRTHPDPVTAAAYAPDGRTVAVGTNGGLTLVWQTPPAPTDAPLDDLRLRHPSR
jgi:WD40 repeat protein